MKALKSLLGKSILSSPSEKEKLRNYMVPMKRTKDLPRSSVTGQLLTVRDAKGKMITVRPVVVAKAD